MNKELTTRTDKEIKNRFRDLIVKLNMSADDVECAYQGYEEIFGEKKEDIKLTTHIVMSVLSENHHGFEILYDFGSEEIIFQYEESYSGADYWIQCIQEEWRGYWEYDKAHDEQDEEVLIHILDLFNYMPEDE